MKHARPHIVAQLWSVNDAMRHDSRNTLKRLAQAGFDGVEFAGEFGEFAQCPRQLSNYLKALGLTAKSAHVPLTTLVDDFTATMAFYQALSVSTLIVPFDERASDSSRIDALIEQLTTLSRDLTPFDVKIGYHNHAEEWQSYAGTTYMEYLAANTPSVVQLQQDVGWTLDAGHDPLAFHQAHAPRTASVHIKSPEKRPVQANPIIGQDGIAWEVIIAGLLQTTPKLTMVLEQESYPEGMTPIDALLASLKGLVRLVPNTIETS